MENRLEKTIIAAAKKFNDKALTEIPTKNYQVAGKTIKILVNKSKIKNALKKTCPTTKSSILSKDMIAHFEELEKFLPFCSSPRSFRSAWDLRSKALNKYDADTLVNEGAQIIPVNKGSRIFEAIQQGVELGQNQRLITAVRHSEGNYDDILDDQGRFSYQPPTDATGMLRYRWCQYLSKQLNVPFFLIAVMWFEYRISKSLNLVFIVSPAKIIDFDSDLNNLGDSLSNPLTLQIVNRSEVYNYLNILYSLNETKLEIETRSPLDEALAREWAFDKINASSKGRKIKKWATKTGKACPGTLCNHIKFGKLDSKNIAFGHIISQDWARSFTYILGKVDHPDNLYLTCQKCNSSLSNNFPDTKLRKEINNRRTIGDWLRSAEHEIRSV